MQKIATAFRKVRQLGLIGAFTHAGRRFLTVVRRGKSVRYFLFVLDSSRPLPAITEAAGHTFRFATIQDLERLMQDAESHIYERDMVSFKMGCRCLLQMEGDKLVGYTWASSAPLIEIMWGFHVNMPDDMIYNFNDYTVPAYRGMAYQGLRHIKMLEDVRAEGKSRLLCFVDHLNYRSLHGVRKSGYRHVGVFHGLRRQGRTHFSLSVEEHCWASIVRSGPVQS